MTVVLDTNVILSAILFGGKPRQVLEAVLSGAVRLSVSESTIAELRTVLGRPKFGVGAQFVETVISELAAIAEWVEPAEHFEVVKDDPSDNRFIECAVAAKADYLITGDNHLLKLRQCRKTRIVNVEDFAGILLEFREKKRD